MRCKACNKILNNFDLFLDPLMELCAYCFGTAKKCKDELVKCENKDEKKKI